MCDAGCETQWYPLFARANDNKDGRRQWAFRNWPVYTHVHDSPDKPIGDGEDGVWHVLPHIPTPVQKL